MEKVGDDPVVQDLTIPILTDRQTISINLPDLSTEPSKDGTQGVPECQRTANLKMPSGEKIDNSDTFAKISEIPNGFISPPNSITSSSSASGSIDPNVSHNLKKIASLYEKFSVQCGELERLEKQNSDYRDQLLSTIRERENNEKIIKDIKDRTAARIQELERKVLEYEYQLKATKDRLSAQEAHFRKDSLEHTTKLNAQIEQLKQSADISQREKNEAVVKFASGESEILKLKSEGLKNVQILQRMSVERNALIDQLKSCQNDREAAQLTVTSLKTRINDLTRQVDAQKSFVREVDQRADCAEKARSDSLEQLIVVEKRLALLNEEKETIKADHRQLLSRLQQDGERAEDNLKEQKKEEQERRDVEVHLKAEQEQRMAVEERERLLSIKMEGLECEFEGQLQERVADAQELCRLKQVEKLVDSCRKEAELSKSACTIACEERRQAEEEAAECRQRAEQMLEMTGKLTHNNSLLTTENCLLNTQNRDINDKCARLQVELDKVSSLFTDTDRDLAQLKECTEAEIESLKRQLDEKIRTEQSLRTLVDDEQNNNKILRKKHAASVKELRSELTTFRRRIKLTEGQTPPEVVSLCSRASSSTSLEVTTNRCSSADQSSIEYQDALHAQTSCPSNQTMIEKIVKLQRQLARRTEKVDFLEEHVRQCVEELQKKSKIIQHYALREQTGALVSDSIDLHKLLGYCQNAQIKQTSLIQPFKWEAVSGGDKRISAELSMEINVRLQTVLEDALVRNMALSDSVDTLGKEISRLSRENRQLTITLNKYQS